MGKALFPEIINSPYGETTMAKEPAPPSQAVPSEEKQKDHVAEYLAACKKVKEYWKAVMKLGAESAEAQGREQAARQLHAMAQGEKAKALAALEAENA